MQRRSSKQVVAGGVAIGGGAPITVQSMLNVPSTDIAGSVEQALRLEQAGCQILRAAIPNKEAVALIPAIKEAVADACRQKNIPIRIGVNSGSLEKHILAKYGAPTPEALVESALYHVSLLEKFDFTDIVISLKASSVDLTVRAYELMAQQCPYPLHLGVTEAGTARMSPAPPAAAPAST